MFMPDGDCFLDGIYDDQIFCMVVAFIAFNLIKQYISVIIMNKTAIR